MLGRPYWSFFCLIFALQAKADHIYPYMADGTVSWQQPDDASMFDYNGRCGETAAANIISMTSQLISPTKVIAKMFDYTPGTKPRTLVAFLNRHAPGFWEYGRTNAEQAIATLRHLLTLGTFKAQNNRSPVAVLVRQSEFSLHWLTVVDISDDSQTVFVNQYGTQYEVDVDRFLDDWGFVDRNNEQWGGGSVVRWSCCHPYSAIYQTH